GEPSADKSGSSAQQKPQEQTPAGTVDVRSMDSARSEGENVESVRQQAQSQRQAVAERADQAQGRPGSASAGQAVSERQTMSRPRRRSGPQIYGQDSMTEYKGTQGVIRRDVHAGSAAAGRNPGYENGTRTQQMSTAERQSVASGTAGRGREGVGQSQEGRADRVINRENSVQGGSVDRRGTRMADQRTGQNIAVPPQRLNARQHGDMQPYAQVPQEDRQQEKGAFAARKILETSRGRLVSTLLLLIALFHTVYFAGAIAAVFMGELDYSLFGRLLGSLPLPAQLASYVSMFQSAMAQLDNGAIVIDLVLQVPDLLFFLGIWLLCITARTSKEQMSGAGFVFLRLAIILNMIAACVLLLVVLVLSVTLVIASGSAGNGRFPLAVAVLAAAIVVAMVIVMYYFCYLGTISAVSKNARLGESYGKTSSYVALVHMALAFTAIINVLSGILNGWIPVAVGGVGKFLWMLLFGIWIFNYRNAMSEYIE
ncbi:MAG: hypothetical protein LUG93_15925, partial [Lachnospiraceae bacterium]|nr:hypothetical protein [Lachnospiraceae bacterium]